LCCRSAILGALPSFKQLQGSRTDDWVDRLSHVITVVLIVILAVVITTAQFAGEPIHCWHPAEWKKIDWYEDYVENYCWISNTYVVGFYEALPTNIYDRKDREITYYQWIPLVLLLQAFLFKCPNVVWIMLHSQGGLNLKKMVKMADQTQLLDPVQRQDTVENMAAILDKWLSNERIYKWNRLAVAKKRLSRFCCLFCSKRNGTYLSGLYTTVKILYLANVIGQFFILNSFMAMNYTVYGFEFLNSLVDNAPWKANARFPLVTFCDIEIRQLQNLQTFTIQCVLPINLFNEKVFVFLWFWMFFVAIMSFVKLLGWFFTVILKRHRSQYVRKYLQIAGTADSFTNFERKMFHRFAHDYLREDGVFVLRTITNNATDLVTTDIVANLWRRFQDRMTAKSSTNRTSTGETTDEKHDY